MLKHRLVPEVNMNSCVECMYHYSHDSAKCNFGGGVRRQCTEKGGIYIPNTDEAFAKYAALKARKRLGIDDGWV